MELSRSERLQRWAPTLAVLAVLFLLAGVLAWLLGGPAQQFSLVRDITLVGGIVLLVAYILLRPGDVSRLLGQRQVRYGTNTTIQVIALLAILVVINYFTLPVSDSLKLNKRWDLTETGELTLSQQTIDLLTSLKAPVKAYGFYTSQNISLQQQAEDLLKQYEYYAGNRFTYQIVNPEFAEGLQLAAQVGASRDASVILVQGDRRQEAESVSEIGITTALNKLVRTNKPVVYFLQGHGEPDINSGDAAGLSNAKQGLEANNYVVRTLVLTSTIPSDAAALVLAGPKTPLTPEETQVISNYLGGGGALFVAVEPDLVLQQTGGQPWGGAFSDYLTKTWGLDFRQDILVDNQAVQSMLNIIVANYGVSTITQEVNRVASLFLQARSVATPQPGAGNFEVTIIPLAQTSADSWSLPNLEDQDFQKYPRGPFAIGVSAENTRTRARLVAFGDVDFIANRTAQNPSIANLTLFLNSVDWLTRQEEQLSIAPKPQVQRALRPVSGVQQTLVALVSIFLLPLLAVSLGVGVWWRRRSA